MSEEIEGLENRLKKLKPLGQDVLAAKIVDSWRSARFKQPALPRGGPFSSLSLGSAFIGALIGAAATFLGTAILFPPKVEIREVVREVHVKPEIATEPAKSETVVTVVRPSPRTESLRNNQPSANAKANDNLDDWLAQSGISVRDLNFFVAQREAGMRQMSRRESESGSTSIGFVPLRLLPQDYRDLLRDLKL